MSVTLVAGSRTIDDQAKVNGLLVALTRSPHLSEITSIIHGGARGVDRRAGLWANAMDIPVKAIPAEWEALGKKAGYARNKVMVDACEQAIVIWDGKSTGTKHTMDLMAASGKPFVIVSLGDAP